MNHYLSIIRMALGFKYETRSLEIAAPTGIMKTRAEQLSQLRLEGKGWLVAIIANEDSATT